MELENKIKEIIFGLFGSIIASFGVSLGASFLTNDHTVILLSGLIVGIASSFANAFGPSDFKFSNANSPNLFQAGFSTGRRIFFSDLHHRRTAACFLCSDWGRGNWENNLGDNRLGSSLHFRSASSSIGTQIPAGIWFFNGLDRRDRRRHFLFPGSFVQIKPVIK